MKYGIIGTGAVGGYYGGLMARCGHDVHFLLRSDYDHVKESGLYVKSKDGDYALPRVNAYCRPEDMPLCDVAIVALKTTENDKLPKILPHMVKEDGIVVVLQNGFSNEMQIAKILPKATVMGGLCFLCCNKTGPGQINHLDFGAVKLCQYTKDGSPSGVTSSLEMIGREFEKAGINIRVCENLMQARWEKLVWNMPFNGLSVVLSSTTDELMQDNDAKTLVREIMIEVITGATRCGYLIDDSFMGIMLEATGNMASYSPSMKLDFDAGRLLEIEQIYWQPIKTAQSAGFHMVKARVIALQLEVLNRQKRGLK